MLYVPFIYFSLFWYYTIKKCGKISMASLLVFVYVLTSFFCILLDITDAYQRNCEKIEITLIPTFLYCGLLTLTICPFLKINNRSVRSILPVQNPKVIDWIVYVYAIMFLLMVILLTPDLLRNWALAEVNDNLKAELRFGGEKSITLTGWKLLIANRCVLLSFGSLNIIPIFFYNLCFRKKKIWFHIITLMGSMTLLFTSVLNQDRSRIVYWMMLFSLCYAFFHKFMSENKKVLMKKVFIAILGVGVAYVAIMNIRRFASGYGNNFESLLGLINYAGQSFINFCHFFENIHLDKINISAGFPITSYVLGINIDSAEWYDYVEKNAGFYAVVFSTFIGELISYMGIPLTILWILLFYVISQKSVRLNKTGNISFCKFLVIYTLISVPYLGIFVHYFHAFITEFLSILFILLSYFASYKIKR